MNMAGSAQTVDLSFLGDLFDSMEDVVVFTKDRNSRYTAVNQTLVRRVGAASKTALLGKRADEVFAGELGQSFRHQDDRVIRTGRPLIDRLELHVYRGSDIGWCLTRKLPLRHGPETVGLAGYSRDLNLGAEERAPSGVARALKRAQTDLETRFTIGELAEIADMPTRTFERAVRNLFGVSAGDLMIKARIDLACRLLVEGTMPVGEIASACGYADQSAFTRQFRARVGVTPRRFRSGETQG